MPACLRALLDDETYRPVWFSAGENLGAAGFAVHLEPFGQADHDILPRHISAEVFLELGDVIARLQGDFSLKPGLDGLLGGFDLFLA
jgi:hypothetical protein